MAKLSIQLGLILIVSATGVAIAAPQHRGGGGGTVRGGGGAHFAAPHVGAFRGHPRSTFHPRGNMSVAKHITPYHHAASHRR
jgi:hypothetical protein